MYLPFLFAVMKVGKESKGGRKKNASSLFRQNSLLRPRRVQVALA